MYVAHIWLVLVMFVLCWQALDTFNAAIVSPIYYVMFTTLTIVASAIMFKVVYIKLKDKEKTYTHYIMGLL